MNETRKRKYCDEYQETPNKFRAVEKEENIKELSLFAKIKNWFMSLIKWYINITLFFHYLYNNENFYSGSVEYFILKS